MTLHIVPDVGGTAIYLALAVFVYRRRPSRPLWPIAFWCQIAGAAFCLGDLWGSYLATTPFSHYIALTGQYAAVAFLPFTWWVLAARFSEAQHLPIRVSRVLIFWAPAAWCGAIPLAMLTNPWHGQFVTPHVGMRSDFHWLWWVLTGGVYVLIAGSLSLYVRVLRRTPDRRVRRQTIILMLAPIVTLGANAYYIFTPPTQFDWTIVALVLSGILLWYGTFRRGLFELLPIALSEILRHDSDGVVLVTEDGDIRYANPAAQSLLDLRPDAGPRNVFALLTEILRPDTPDHALSHTPVELRRTLTAMPQPAEGHLYWFGSQPIRWLRIEGTPLPARWQAQPLYSLRLREVTAFKHATDMVAGQAAILQQQHDLLRGVAEASTALLATQDSAEALQRTLAIIGEAAAVDRVYIIQFHGHPEDTAPALSVQNVWYAGPDVEPGAGIPLQNLRLRDHGWEPWYSAFQRGDTVSGPVSAEDPRSRAYFEALGVQSHLLVPIFVYGILWGGVGFDDCHAARDWGVDTEAILRAVAISLAGAIEREEARAALVASETRYRQLVENAPLGVVALDNAGRIVAMNPALVTMLGAPDAQAIIAQNPLQPDSPFDEQIMAIVRRCLEEGEEGVVEVAAATSWGKEVNVRIHYVPVRDDGGAIVGLQGLVEDIAGHKRAEEALRESETRYRRLVENAPLGVIACDRSGQVVAVNEYLVDLLGSPSAEATMQFNLLTLPPLVEAGIAAAVRRTMDTGVGHVGEYTYTSHWEKTVEMRLHLAPYTDADGRVTGLQAIVENITERKQAEAAMLHAQKLESLGVLAGGIAHDFNNLLVSVMGNAGLALADVPSDSTVRHHLLAIETAAERASDLTQQMLAYAGKGSFVVQPLDLSHTVREMTPFLEVSIAKSATVEYELATLPTTVEGDAAQIRQIVMNLVLNASEAVGATEGTLRVRTGHRRITLDDVPLMLGGLVPEPGPYVYLAVSDTGCGMDEDTCARMFDPFFSTKFTGRGLGLAAVLGIVQRHGGGLTVRTAPGEGTTFTVFLPASDKAIPAPPASPLPTDQGAWRGVGTILVVDDDVEVLGVATHILERSGFTVVTAEDGPEGLAVFDAHNGSIRAVLLDMTMPRMSGEETFHALRKRRADLPVILSSGYSEQEATTRFAGQGLAGFIQKPYRASALRAKLREALEAAPSSVP